jgi:hypothetical protein
MTGAQRGAILLLASLALPVIYFFSPLSRWTAFTTWGFPCVWLTAITLSVLSAKYLSKWCYIATAVLSAACLFMMFVLASVRNKWN